MPKPAPPSQNADDAQRFHGFFRPGLLALFWLGFVVYGSLIPFNFHLGQTFSAWLTSPRWISATGESSLGITASTSDIAVNIFLYIPFAMFLRMALMRFSRSAFLQISVACASVFVVSWLMECTQSLSPSRVASLYDVAANVGFGCIGAAIAPWVWNLLSGALFFTYCKSAPIRQAMRCVYLRARHWPAALYVIALFNAVILTTWYILELSGASASAGESALPFEAQFLLPYDVAALVLGRSLLLYVMLGSLISIVAMRHRTRARLRWVVLGVVLVAFGVELFSSMTAGSRPDLTQPILAAIAAVLMGLTMFTFSYAVRRSCRRRSMQAYEGEDRRNQSHRYGV